MVGNFTTWFTSWLFLDSFGLDSFIPSSTSAGGFRVINFTSLLKRFLQAYLWRDRHWIFHFNLLKSNQCTAPTSCLSIHSSHLFLTDLWVTTIRSSKWGKYPVAELVVFIPFWTRSGTRSFSKFQHCFFEALWMR